MSSGRKATFMVALFLIGSLSMPDFDEQLPEKTSFFDGFSVQSDIWNESPLHSVAVPMGFDMDSVIDYSDVGVLINNESEISRTIGWAFVTARNISAERVFIFDNTSTPTGETINRNQFTTYFEEPFRAMLSNYNGTDLNYLVTTKGIPLRINGGNNKASFDQELSLIGGSYDSFIEQDWWIDHDYGPLAGKQMKEFTRDEYGFFLVTRLTGYTLDTALDLIEKANDSYGARGTHVLDLATNRNDTGYKFWNDDLYVANTTLNGTLNLPVYFDQETEFITNKSNVIGYASWGSNDGNWNKNYLANGGFDTLDDTWQSGSRYWNHSSPIVSAGDVFNWEYQTDTKQGGNGAFEAQVQSECNQETGYFVQGIYAEYFDNEGISFNVASMPDLIDRVPDHIRIESSLAYGSSGNAYPGLDDRFKNNWGARFSGLIDVPESGNWTFYLNTDDGSELWINGVSTIQNYGSHGMREYSATINLNAGYHDFKVEFFQGGGPHGLKLSWEGPNVSKATIPSTAFYIDGDYVPQESNLIHQWKFNEGSGSQSNDSVSNGSNFTLYGMDANNWVDCIDGKCLLFDGVDDYAKVNVDDWLGDFTISQWVWANTSNQTNYAATFAIDDNAGSNQSFQHMIYNQEWRLHNNQSKVFGDVVDKKWTHLVTVFDSGETRQYMDGVLVNTNSYPNGSLNNFDLYKIGVNRAGSSYFEGMIDNLMIWDTALTNGSVTVLNRNIINNCTAYSGNGQSVAYLETTHQIPENFTDHAWVVYTHGMRTGDVFGEYHLRVNSYDSNGNLLSTNSSSKQDFNPTWNSRDMRFRPHADATSMEIRISLDIVPTSTDGSLFVDSTVLRIIRPHMDWVNGSIVETAVSTAARSFNFGTSYGQSLIADILEDGASGVKGYVYEPYLTAVSSPSVLLSSYASGYNLAESYAAANTMIGWMGVVVGDPKMSPYADIVHDVEIIDIRVLENASVNRSFKLEVALQNIGPGEAKGELKVMDKLGSVILANQTLTIADGSQNGSRLIVELEVNSSRKGWNNLVIRWDSISQSYPEKNIENNAFDYIIWVNSEPEIDAVYCDSNQYSRGDRFVCSVDANDDSGISDVNIGWRVTSENISTEWVWKNTGSQDNTTWWTTINLPNNVPLGVLDIAVNVTDNSNVTSTEVSLGIAAIRDAPAFWYGTHVSGVDDPDWGGASILTSVPVQGVTRGSILTLKACVLDPDHDQITQVPMITASRGQIDGLTYRAGSSVGHHCYIASFNLAPGSSLEPFTIELRNSEGDFLTKRTIQVSDLVPEIELSIVNANRTPIQNVLAGGNDYLLVEVIDFDDDISGVYGDAEINWPGQTPFTIPVEFENGSAMIDLYTNQAIENGDLTINISVTGANGGKNTESLQTPILLSPPEILSIELCKDGSEIEQLMFGQTADAVIRIRSSRPISEASATIEQIGWTASAPPQDDADCGIDIADQTDKFSFRIQLDSSFVPGDGKLGVRVMDIDEIVSISYLDFEFLHSPPSISVNHPSSLPNSGLFELLVEMNDADGIDASCSISYSQNNTQVYSRDKSVVTDLDGTGIWSTSWLLPAKIFGNLTILVDCEDWSGNNVNYSAIVEVMQSDVCLENCSKNGQGIEDNIAGKSTKIYFALFALVIIIVTITTVLIQRRRKDEPVTEQWENENEEPVTDDRIPEGWTLEEFIDWLDGPMPEEWQEDQWELYRTSMEDLRL